MLMIKAQQLNIMAQLRLQQVERNMVDHIKMYFPHHVRLCGEPTILRMIRHGIERAEGYRLTTERDVCLYITVMFMLGTHFDEDLLFPWAKEILATEENVPTVRADQLADTALAYQSQIAGHGNQFINQAFMNLRNEYRDLLFSTMGQNFTAWVQERLHGLFPQKHEILGEARINQLILLGQQAAKGYEIISIHGQWLYIVMMFFMGTKFDRDPFVSWAHAILTNPRSDEQTRVQRLHEAGAGFLEQWFECSLNQDNG